jgi:2'-5' RNA ligase
MNPPRNIREFVPDLVGTPVPSEPFVVDRLVLYRSHLSPKGATYEPLITAPFSAQT